METEEAKTEEVAAYAIIRSIWVPLICLGILPFFVSKEATIGAFALVSGILTLTLAYRKRIPFPKRLATIVAAKPLSAGTAIMAVEVAPDDGPWATVAMVIVVLCTLVFLSAMITLWIGTFFKRNWLYSQEDVAKFSED